MCRKNIKTKIIKIIKILSSDFGNLIRHTVNKHGIKSQLFFGINCLEKRILTA